MHQPTQVVPAREAGDQLVLVLVHPSLEVAGNPDVQPVSLVCQDVDVVVAQWSWILRRYAPQNDTGAFAGASGLDVSTSLTINLLAHDPESEGFIFAHAGTQDGEGSDLIPNSRLAIPGISVIVR